MALIMSAKISLCLLMLACVYAQSPQYKWNGCANGTVWQPSPGTTWIWDLSKEVTVDVVYKYDVQVYDIDMFYVTADMVNAIHAKGSVLVCYIDTAYEPFRPDANMFEAADLGSDMDGWPGQKWVNIESPNVRRIMESRLNQAWAKGCDAIEWDDVDCYKNKPGFPINGTIQANFNAFLARITHAYNMSVGLKNDLDQIWLLEPYFDWVLNEQCYQYGECDKLQDFMDAGKCVFGAEYKNSASKICKKQNSLGFSWLRTDLDLDTQDTTLCCSYENPPCGGAPQLCVQPPTEYPFLIDNSATHVYVSVAALACMLLALLL